MLDYNLIWNDFILAVATKIPIEIARFGSDQFG